MIQPRVFPELNITLPEIPMAKSFRGPAGISSTASSLLPVDFTQNDRDYQSDKRTGKLQVKKHVRFILLIHVFNPR